MSWIVLVSLELVTHWTLHSRQRRIGFLSLLQAQTANGRWLPWQIFRPMSTRPLVLRACIRHTKWFEDSKRCVEFLFEAGPTWDHTTYQWVWLVCPVCFDGWEALDTGERVTCLTLCWAWSSLPGTTSSWDMGRSLGRQMPWAKLPKSYEKTATSSNNLYHYSSADTSRTSASGRWQNGSANSTPCYKVWPTIVLVVCNILRMFSLSPKW